MCGGGSGPVQAPPVDPAQQALETQQAALISEQNTILTQQANNQKVIAPMLYQSMGLNPVFDNNGNLVSLTQNPQTQANFNLQQQVTGQTLQQEQQALAGKLPVNPLVRSTLQQQQQQLTQTLNTNLGPGAAASTPGIMAQNRFNTNQAGIIQGANTGQLSLDQQLAAAGQSTSGANLGQTLGGVMGVNSLGFNTAGAFGAASGAAGAAQAPYIAQASNTLAANQANAAYSAQSSAGYGQLAGTLGSAAILALALA